MESLQQALVFLDIAVGNGGFKKVDEASMAKATITNAMNSYSTLERINKSLEEKVKKLESEVEKLKIKK